MSIKIDFDDVRRAGSVEAAILKWAENSQYASGVIGTEFSTSGPGSGWSIRHDASDFAARALDAKYGDAEYGALYYIDESDGRVAHLVEKESADSYLALRGGNVVGEIEVVTCPPKSRGCGHIVYLVRLQNCDTGFATVMSGDAETWEDDDGQWDIRRPATPEEAAEAMELWEQMPEPDEVEYKIVWSDESEIELVCPDIEYAIKYPDETAEMAQAVIDIHGAQIDKDAWRQLIRDVKRAAAAFEDIDEDELSD